MTKVLVNEENLTNIANAIRGKNGGTTTYKPGDMALAISNIPSMTTPKIGFVPTAWKTSGNNQQIGLITEGIWYGNLTQAAFATNPPDYVYNGPFGYLQNVIFADEITTIANYAFYQCRSLALTSLPNSIISIRSYAFYNCAALALTSLPENLKSISDYGFEGCSSLAITKLPNQITEISWSAFSKCTSLVELTCEGNIATIEANAFSSCSALAKIVFPNITSVPVLDATNAFSGTPMVAGTGYFYVPDELVDSFKSATNWSSYADQIKGISELEVNA